jgi:hypothetical protein
MMLVFPKGLMLIAAAALSQCDKLEVGSKYESLAWG